MKRTNVVQKMPLTIGVCGMNHGSGATTVAFAIANYLKSGQNLWVACIELNNSNAFSFFGGKKDHSTFHYCGIDFYPDSTPLEYTAIATEPYDALILDLGVLNKNTIPEFLRCNIRIALGYISPWKRDSYWQWIHRVSTQELFRNKEIIYMGNLSGPDDAKSFHHQYGINTVPVPYIENPFQLSSVNWSFIERVLGKVPYTTSKTFFRARRKP